MIGLLFLDHFIQLEQLLLIDLHCHSDCSDGSLPPLELIKHAEERNIKMLAITDHDTIDAYDNLPQTGIEIISGVEFSTTWNKIGIHIIGLDFDLKSPFILNAIASQKLIRRQRAETIASRLEKHGLSDAYEKLKHKNYIGRPDFAQLLVEQGLCKDFNQAFKKYLGAGKVGDVKNQWLSFNTIINAILNAGGIPVLAHPLHYKLTNTKLKKLISEYKLHGGIGIEVVNGYQNNDKTAYLIKLCQEFNMKASVGSDFHRHNQWKKLGCSVDIVNDVELVLSIMQNQPIKN